MFNILVVDDDKNTRNLFSALLKNEGFSVQTAEDGESALEAIDKIHVDLIVADVMMPGMDGYALTEGGMQLYTCTLDNLSPIPHGVPNLSLIHI